MKRRNITAANLVVVFAIFLTACTPSSIPVVDTITNANLGPLKLDKEVKGYCNPMELFCGDPLFEPAFSSPNSADPVEVCNAVVDLQSKIGMVAFAAAGADAAKVTSLKEVKDFCAQGFELGGDDGAGNPFYEGTVLYDDGEKDGVGKVTVISRSAEQGYFVVFSVSRNLGRVGWVPYGGSPKHMNTSD